MEKKSCDNCERKAECRYPGRPCRYRIEKPLSPTMKKLDAMIREELR